MTEPAVNKDGTARGTGRQTRVLKSAQNAALAHVEKGEPVPDDLKLKIMYAQLTMLEVNERNSKVRLEMLQKIQAIEAKMEGKEQAFKIDDAPDEVLMKIAQLKERGIRPYPIKM